MLAQSAAARAVDTLTSSLPLGQDIAVGAWLILILCAAVATSWLVRLSLPPTIAIGCGVGLTFLRTPWSSHAVGRDALLLCGALLVAHAVARPQAPLSRRTARAVAVLTLVLVAHQPSLAWLLAPLCLAMPSLSGHERRWWAGLTVTCALGAALVHAVLVRNAEVCIAGGGLTPWVSAAMLPGRVQGGTTWASTTQALTALTSNVHVFGLVAAVWAVWLVGDRFRDLRRLTPVGVLACLTAAAVGAVTTETFVWMALALWLPWYGLAGQALWDQAQGRWRLTGRLSVIGLVVLLPIGRHAVFVAEAVAADAPHVYTHADAWLGNAVRLAGDVQGARRVRAAHRAVVPMEASRITDCLARGRQIVATGPALETLRAEGAELEVLPVAVPLTALLADVRPGAVVAFGATSEALRWLRPADSTGLSALGLQANALRARRAQALVVSIPATAGEATSARHADAASTEVATVMDGRTLWHPIAVTTSPDGVVVETRSPGATPLVHGRAGGLAVFNRAEIAVVRGTAAAEPGLPITVHSLLPSMTWARVVEWRVPSAVRPTHGTVATAPLLPAHLVDDATHRTVPVQLGDGWHDAEPAGPSFFRWSARVDATATFRLEHPSDLHVSIDAAPAQTDALPNSLRLVVNGIPVGEVLQGHAAFDVPASSTRAGVNTLTLLTDTVVPAGVVPGEPRVLGAVVRRLRLERR